MIKKVMIIITLCITFIGVKVKAITINTQNNIGDIEDIIEIAKNKDELYYKKYVILDNGTLKMIIFKKEDYEIENNQIKIANAKIITKTNGIVEIEDNVQDVIINVNNSIYSNVDIEKAKVNNELDMYINSKWKEKIIIIMLGVGIAILFTKGVME